MRDKVEKAIPIFAGSLCSSFAAYPIDILRCLRMSTAADPKERFLVLVSRFRNHYSLFGFIRQGLFAEMLRTTCLRLSKFFIYPFAHQSITGQSPSKGTITTRIGAGVLASIPECLIVTPIEFAKLALQLNHGPLHHPILPFRRSAFLAAKFLHQKQGISGLFTGYTALQYRHSAFCVAYFATLTPLENLIRRLSKDTKLANTPIIPLVAGAFAGVVGALASTPGDVVRTNIQKAALWKEFDIESRVGSLKMASQIVKSRGLLGLWYGVGFKIVHAGGSGAMIAVLTPIFQQALNSVESSGLLRRNLD